MNPDNFKDLKNNLNNLVDLLLKEILFFSRQISENHIIQHLPGVMTNFTNYLSLFIRDLFSIFTTEKQVVFSLIAKVCIF